MVIAAFVGCFQDESYDSTLIFRSVEQLESGGDLFDLEGVRVYAFAADTLYYIPQSYEEAYAGIVTNKEDGDQLSPIATSSEYSGYFTYTYEIEEEDEDDDDDEEVVYPYEDGEVVTTLITGVALQATRSQVLLVAVDTKNENYAYCNYDVGLNLPTTYITLTFRPWKSESFSQSFWWFVVEDTDTTEL